MRYDDRLEEGLRRMRDGATLTEASRAIDVSPSRLRRYLIQSGVGVREEGVWRVGVDLRSRQVPLYTSGRAIDITVPGYEAAAEVGRFMADAGRFQVSNDPLILAPYRGRGVTDVHGRFHPFETDPNTLYRLMAAGPEPFELIYRIVV